MAETMMNDQLATAATCSASLRSTAGGAEHSQQHIAD